MGFAFAEVDREGPITIVTLNRPEVLNALHSKANFELAEIFDDFSADPDQWVAILTGKGSRAFCAGNDLKNQARGDDLTVPGTGFAGLCQRFDLNKPLIAAVNGVAMGGGFETALACDIILASDNAVFALPEPRVGMIAGMGGMQRLPRAIGLQRALSIALTSRRVGAVEAKELGLVSAVTSLDALLDTARDWARQICESSQLAVRAAKETIVRGLDEASMLDALTNCWDYPAFAALMDSEDSIEGPAAFTEKRAPRWSERPIAGGRPVSIRPSWARPLS